MTKFFAVFVTLIACSMSSAAAWDRGGNIIDRSLLVAISFVIVLAVHLLPGLSKRPATWMVWGACLIAAIYGHLTFLTHASLRASTLRAEQSAMTVGTENQIATIKSALGSIHARPVSIIASELAVAEDGRIRTALREEIKEAKRFEVLQDQLTKLYATATIAKTSEGTDPVVGKLTELTGFSQAQITITIGLVLSVLVELVGTLLWYEALKNNKPVTKQAEPIKDAVTAITALPVASNQDTVIKVRNAVVRGECKPTVSSIRLFLSCSQDKAMMIRRELVGNT